MRNKDGSPIQDAPEHDVQSRRRDTTVYGSVDKGWAWIILIAITFWNNLIAGTLKSFGIIYLEYLELYRRGPVATAWLGFSYSIAITVMAPVSGYIGDHVSLKRQRVMVMALSVVMATAVAATGWMPRLEGAIVTYGIAGFAASVVDTPILSLICKYFKKRQFLASGIVFAGSSFGTLILPPLITYLVECYAIRGALVILGGIWLNVMVVGAAMRPIRAIPANSAADSLDDVENETEFPEADATMDEIKRSTLSLEIRTMPVNMFISCSRRSLDRIRERTSFQNHQQSRSVPCIPMSTTNDPNLNTDGTSVSTHMAPNNSNTCTDPADQTETKGGERCNVVELSICEKSCSILRAYWQFIKTPRLPLLVFTLCAASFGYFNQFFVFPSLARELQMTKLQGAMLVSVSNITELLSRLLVGLLVDRGLIRKPLLVQLSFALSAVLAMAVSFFRHQTLLFVYSGLFGLLGGVFIPFAIPLMAELVPVSQISSAAGVFVLVTGIGISLGPPILGGVKALTGSFTDPLRVCSTCYVLALGSYVIHRRRHVKGETQRKTFDLEIR